MGGARALVTGSTSWPACSCRVSNLGSLQDERERHGMRRGRPETETPLLVEGRHRGAMLEKERKKETQGGNIELRFEHQ